MIEYHAMIYQQCT